METLQLPKETNIERIREVALEYLNQEPIKCEEFEHTVYHPFFNSDSFIDIVKPQMEGFIKKATNINTLFALIDRRYKWRFFVDTMHSLSKSDFTKELKYIWIDSEGISASTIPFDTFILMFNTANRKGLFEKSKNPQYDFKNFGEEIKIYRGICETGTTTTPMGMSWTVDYDKAYYFATRFFDEGYIIEGLVKKSDVLAYFTSRNEYEIIVNPKSVKKTRKIEL